MFHNNGYNSGYGHQDHNDYCSTSEDVIKVTELKDTFGIKRYKVTLADKNNIKYLLDKVVETTDPIEFHAMTTHLHVVDNVNKLIHEINDLKVMNDIDKDDSCLWFVCVEKYGFTFELNILLVRDQFTNYESAAKAFEYNLQLYRYLIELETKHNQDITIFADKIGYRYNKCCETCKWSSRCNGYLVCRNEKLFTKNPYPHFPDHHDPYYLHHFVPLSPRVLTYGVCDNYQQD